MKFIYLLRKLTRHLHKKRGLRRLSEIVRKKNSGRLGTWDIQDFDGDLYFGCELSSHIGSQIFWNGMYSGSQLKLLDKILTQDMTFIDVGANEGEHTIFAAKRLKSGQIYSFEPYTPVRKKLERNIRLNAFHNIQVISQGLGESAGRLSLYCSESLAQDGSQNTGLPSVHRRPGVEQIIDTVEVNTLDHFLEVEKPQRVDLIKIDVEGSEMAVLKGAKKSIEKFRPVLFLEVCEETCAAAGYTPSDLLEFVKSLGYRFENILENGGTSQVDENFTNIARDIICYPRSRLSQV